MPVVHQFVHPIKGRLTIDELDECEALLIINSIPSLGAIKTRLLLQYFGSAKVALQAEEQMIASLPGFGPKIAQQWRYWPTADGWKQNLQLIERANVELIAINSPLYPKKLLDLPDPPTLLYGRGDLTKLKKSAIAIVGTRQASVYGNEQALMFAKELAAHGFLIISGLARGIDTTAHRGALATGSTAAVIGSGLANIYPTENRSLAEQIALQGFLLSEFPMATPPDRQNFPQRNRIVAALAEAIVLIEAPLKSGAILTMQHGQALGRRLYALPGRVDNPNFQGNHALIKNGQAQLVESPNDILASFDGLFAPDRHSHRSKGMRIQLDKEEHELLQSLPKEELTIDQIAERFRLPIAQLHILLMSLVLKGAVKEFPGKVFKKEYNG